MAFRPVLVFTLLEGFHGGAAVFFYEFGLLSYPCGLPLGDTVVDGSFGPRFLVHFECQNVQGHPLLNCLSLVWYG
jgi:hypothetical protein